MCGYVAPNTMLSYCEPTCPVCISTCTVQCVYPKNYSLSELYNYYDKSYTNDSSNGSLSDVPVWLNYRYVLKADHNVKATVGWERLTGIIP